MVRYKEMVTAIDRENKKVKINGVWLDDSVKTYRKLVDERANNVFGPVVRYYNFPSRYDSPMPHQVVTVDFIIGRRRGFIFNDIGTGKTLCMDWAFDFLKKSGEVRRGLIIAPLSTIQSVHAEEIRWSFPWLKYEILYGTRRDRLTALKKDADIYIINFDGVKILGNFLVQREDIDIVFIDEIAVLRNKQTYLWKAINELCGMRTNKMVFGFTGSPMPKAPTDAYSQALLINPSRLPQQYDYRSNKERPISFTRFKHITMFQASEWSWKPKQGWKEICHRVLQPSIRFAREQVEKNLPPVIVETREIELTPAQKTAYKNMS